MKHADAEGRPRHVFIKPLPGVARTHAERLAAEYMLQKVRSVVFPRERSNGKLMGFKFGSIVRRCVAGLRVRHQGGGWILNLLWQHDFTDVARCIRNNIGDLRERKSEPRRSTNPLLYNVTLQMERAKPVKDLLLQIVAKSKLVE